MDIVSSAKKRARSLWDPPATVFDAPKPATVFADAEPKNDASGPHVVLADGSVMIVPSHTQMEAALGQKISAQEYEQRVNMETLRANESIVANAKKVGEGAVASASGAGSLAGENASPLSASTPFKPAKMTVPARQALKPTPKDADASPEQVVETAAPSDVGRGGVKVVEAAPKPAAQGAPVLQKPAPALQKVYKWTPKGLVEDFVDASKMIGGGMAGVGTIVPDLQTSNATRFRENAPPKWKVEDIEGRPLTNDEYHAWLSRGMY